MIGKVWKAIFNSSRSKGIAAPNLNPYYSIVKFQPNVMWGSDKSFDLKQPNPL